jgi:hypothetical protein
MGSSWPCLHARADLAWLLRNNRWGSPWLYIPSNIHCRGCMVLRHLPAGVANWVCWIGICNRRTIIQKFIGNYKPSTATDCVHCALHVVYGLYTANVGNRSRCARLLTPRLPFTATAAKALPPVYKTISCYSYAGRLLAIAASVSIPLLAPFSKRDSQQNGACLPGGLQCVQAPRGAACQAAGG